MQLPESNGLFRKRSLETQVVSTTETAGWNCYMYLQKYAPFFPLSTFSKPIISTPSSLFSFEYFFPLSERIDKCYFLCALLLFNLFSHPGSSVLAWHFAVVRNQWKGIEVIKSPPFSFKYWDRCVFAQHQTAFRGVKVQSIISGFIWNW